MATVLIQIVEQPGAGLFHELQSAMRSGRLKTFMLEKRGKKVVHKSTDYPGWMNWSHQHGVITATVLSPNKPGAEWKLLSAFIGRLADKYAHMIVSIALQFLASEPPGKAGAAPRRRVR